MSTSQLVLVTGGTGFVATHVILLLLQKGFLVRTTIRNLSKVESIKQTLLSPGTITQEQLQNLAFAEADLCKDAGWQEACGGCSYVVHCASPFPVGQPKDAHVLIKPAKEGTLRVLNAAKNARTVKRIVITSSFAAIAYGHAKSRTTFTEKDWTDASAPEVPPYQKSKAIAERAAWDWLAESGGDMEMAVINPVTVFGPVLSKDNASSPSLEIVRRMMDGEVPGILNITVPCVDVRDLADLHLSAMLDLRAAGERFIGSSDETIFMFADIAAALKEAFGSKANKVGTRKVPNLLLRAVGCFNAGMGSLVPELGLYKGGENFKAKTVLGWKPRSAAESVVATAESMEAVGLLKSKK